jgi:hypothetical protein
MRGAVLLGGLDEPLHLPGLVLLDVLEVGNGANRFAAMPERHIFCIGSSRGSTAVACNGATVTAASM